MNRILVIRKFRTTAADGKPLEFDRFKKQAGLNSCALTASKVAELEKKVNRHLERMGFEV